MIRPIGEYILVQCEPAPAKSDGGLILPEQFAGRARHQGDGVLTLGTVLAVGKGDLQLKGRCRGEFVPIDCQPGDRILFPRHELCPDLGDDQTIIHQQHVFGVVGADFALANVIRHVPQSRPARGYVEKEGEYVE
jgi:co-chaperonin GroES (HSP10)